MRPRTLLAPLALLVALPVARPAVAQTAERYTLRGRDAAVYDPAGRVQVVAGSGNDIVVEVTRRGRDAGRLRVLTGEVRGQDAVRIVAPAGDLIYPALGRGSSSSFQVRSDGTFGGDDDGGDRGFFSRGSSDRLTVRGDGSGTEAWADVVVRVPAGRTLLIQAGVGAASAQDVNADLTLRTTAGDVSTERTRGRLTVGAGSGDVRVRDAQGSEMRVGTGSGDAEVQNVRAERISVGTGSGDVRGGGLDAPDVQLGTGSGDLRFGLVRARTLRLGSGSGSTEVTLADGLQEARVGTGSGDVTLRVSPTFGATLDVTTGNGGIRSELPIQYTRQDAHHVAGRLGDGRASVRVSSGSGEVRLVVAR